MRRVAAAPVLAAALAACNPELVEPPARFPDDIVAEPTTRPVEGDIETAFAVPPPPFSEGVFPCQRCHATLVANRASRAVPDHPGVELDHGPRPGWCFDCHDATNRDVLHLTSGDPVPFTESYRLCGQCHGEHLRDWRLGIHGRRTGAWNGAKQYLLCAHCHDPHRPHFQPIEPLPPPLRPAPARRTP